MKEIQKAEDTKDYSKLDKRYTFRPEISRYSRDLAMRRFYSRETSSSGRIEELFSEKLQKSKSRSRKEISTISEA